MAKRLRRCWICGWAAPAGEKIQLPRDPEGSGKGSPICRWCYLNRYGKSYEPVSGEDRLPLR
jgi:hypothetical protein